MYNPAITLPNTPVITITADKIYFVDVDDDIAEIEKVNFSSRKIISRNNIAASVLPRQNDVLIYADNKTYIKHTDGTLHKISDQLNPVAVLQNGIIGTEYENNKNAIAFIDNSGNRLWKVDITMLTNTFMTHNNAFYFCDHDASLNPAFHLIQKIDIATGINTLLIDFNQHFGNDPVYKNLEYLEYFFLFSYDNTIVCLINEYKIVGIDATNGALQWVIDEITDNAGNTLKGFINGARHSGIHNNKFYILHAKRLFCIDVVNKKLTELCQIHEDLQGNPISIHKSRIYGNKFFYTAENRNKHTWNLLGVFDIDQQKIIWQTEIDIPKRDFLAVPPYADENYIYLPVGASSLHIFKKI